MTNEERKELARRIAVETHKLNGGRVEIKPEGLDWREFDRWHFDWIRCDYRIAEPKKRKIKLEAWMNKTYGCVEYRRYPHGFFGNSEWTRLPDLDQEIEVME